MPSERSLRVCGAAEISVLSGIVAVLALAVYRAATQPITVDEARLFDLYIQHHPFYEIFTRKYDAANHVLHTTLAFRSVRWFGTCELALRVPSLIAAIFYLAAVWRIASMVFRRAPLVVLAMGLAVLNPLVLDHMSLARGYSLALAFFAWSLYLSLRFFDEDAGRAILAGAGLCLGLSVAANLTFAIPAMGLSLSVLCLLRKHANRLRLSFEYCLSALLIAAIVLAVPLRSMQPADFYFGAMDLHSSILTLTYSSLRVGDWLPYTWAELYDRVILVAGLGMFPLMLAGIGFIWFKTWRDDGRSTYCFRLIAGSLLISVLILFIAHALFHLRYPYERTGLYLIVLFPLALLSATSVTAARNSAIRFVRLVVLVSMTVVLCIYCLELHAGRFTECAYAADIRNYLSTIQAREQGRIRPVRIGGNFTFSYILNYYRDTRRWTWFERLKNENQFTPGYDYYLLLWDDSHYLAELNLKTVAQTDVSMLAVP